MEVALLPSNFFTDYSFSFFTHFYVGVFNSLRAACRDRIIEQPRKTKAEPPSPSYFDHKMIMTMVMMKRTTVNISIH